MPTSLSAESASGSSRSRHRIERLAITAGLALFVMVAVSMLWSGSGERGARRELRAASARYLAKQREVDEARRLLARRLAELRASEDDAIASGRLLQAQLARRGTGDSASTSTMARRTDGSTTVHVVPVALVARVPAGAP